MLERELTILRLVRDATNRGLMTWEQSDSDEDHYFTTSGVHSTSIQFKWVAFNGAVGSDRDFVEVGGAGRHMVGTPGWWLALEILAAANVAHWREHNERIATAYDPTIRQLQTALEDCDVDESSNY